MRPIAYVLAAIALVAVVVIGLSQAGGDAPTEPERNRFDLEQARADLQGAPGPLAALYRQANRVLPADDFRPALDDLEGHPVVINKWASWCAPCRAEFPVFQEVATARGKEVAFVGLNAEDKRPAAERFLDEFPLPFPSYEDDDQRYARELRSGGGFPMTAFVDRRGEVEFVHAGQYKTAAELEADIDRYLGE